MAPLVGDAAGDADVLVARATPAGAGALAIVRLTGPAGVTLAVARRVAPRIPGHPVARRAYLSPYVDEDGGVVDEGLELWCESPASSTGEEVVELQAHGSPAVVEALVSSAVARGARRARPGEFTRRALANGKIDLLRAEGIGLLAAAASRGEARRALGLVRGELSGRVTALREELLEALVELEARLDFAEDVEDIEGSRAAERRSCWPGSSPVGRRSLSSARRPVRGAVARGLRPWSSWGLRTPESRPFSTLFSARTGRW
jgi:tRNA modification GTPase